MLSYGVIWAVKLISENNEMIIAPGIKLAKVLYTVGGTPFGILIVQSCSTTQLNTLPTIKPNIIATHKPRTPKNSKVNPSGSSTVIVGVTIKNAIKLIKPAPALSISGFILLTNL